MQSGVFGEDIQSPEVYDKSESSDKEVSHELDKEIIGCSVEDFFEFISRVHLLS